MGLRIVQNIDIFQLIFFIIEKIFSKKVLEDLSLNMSKYMKLHIFLLKLFLFNTEWWHFHIYMENGKSITYLYLHIFGHKTLKYLSFVKP